MAGSSEIRAGKAFVELYLQDNKLTRGLDALGGKLKSLGAGIAGIGAGFAAMGAAILGPLAAAVAVATDAGSEMQDLADRTGETVENLSALKYAAEQSAAGVEDLEKALRKMQQQGLGTGVDDLIKFADEIADLDDPAKQTARAMEIFGKSGAALLPLLKGGSDGIRELMGEAKDLGLVMSGEDASAAESFGDELAKLEKMAKMAVVQIGFALIPTLQELIKPVVQATSEILAFIKANREIAVTVAAVGVGLVAAGGALMLLGAGVTAAGFALTGLSAIIGAVGTVIGFILSPVGLVVAAIVALVAGMGYLAFHSSVVQDAVGDLGESFTELWGQFKQTWGGITDAIKAGEWQLAFEIAWTQIEIVFLRGAKALRGIWSDLLNWMVDRWLQATSWIAKQMLKVIDGVSEDDAEAARKQVVANTKRSMGILSGDETRKRFDDQIAVLNARLAELIAQAKSKAGALAVENKAAKKINSMMEGGGSMGIAAASAGTFSSYGIGQSLAVSDKLSQRIAEATERTANATEKMANGKPGEGKGVFRDDGG